MSDYMFMVESHLNAAQMVAFQTVQAAANEANIPLYLTGAALRDMLGGFPIQDLDFTVEGNPVLLAKAIVKKGGCELGETDTKKGLAEVLFPRSVTVRMGMARKEVYPKPASKPRSSASLWLRRGPPMTKRNRSRRPRAFARSKLGRSCRKSSIRLARLLTARSSPASRATISS